MRRSGRIASNSSTVSSVNLRFAVAQQDDIRNNTFAEFSNPEGRQWAQCEQFLGPRGIRNYATVHRFPDQVEIHMVHFKWLVIYLTYGAQ